MSVTHSIGGLHNGLGVLQLVFQTLDLLYERGNSELSIRQLRLGGGVLGVELVKLGLQVSTLISAVRQQLQKRSTKHTHTANKRYAYTVKYPGIAK